MQIKETPSKIDFGRWPLFTESISENQQPQNHFENIDAIKQINELPRLFKDIPNDDNYTCFGLEKCAGKNADSSFASADEVKKK
jgi:hypothetical protein